MRTRDVRDDVNEQRISAKMRVIACIVDVDVIVVGIVIIPMRLWLYSRQFNYESRFSPLIRIPHDK